MKPTLVFDYDGTIHNTIVIYEKAFRECYRWLVSQKYVKEEKISTQQISHWLGVNSKDMWNSFQPDLSDKIKEKASGMISDMMAAQIMEGKARWYPETNKVLDELAALGYNMVILSNCKISYREANWKNFSMERWFSKFYDCQTFNFAPKTEIIKTVQRENQDDLIVIGDRKSDLDCAKACNGKFVGCLYGFGEEGELDGADVFIRSFRQLPEAIKKI